MITFETLITLIVTLIVGYLSIMVALNKPSESKKSSNSPPEKGGAKIIISILFLLFLILVFLLYYLDSTTLIIQLLQQAFNVITPIKGNAFMKDNFTTIFLVGYGILSIPMIVAFCKNFFEKTKKPSCSKICSVTFEILLTLLVSAWVEYYVSFSVYNTFADFSFFHSLIANFILNGIITIISTVMIEEFLKS